MRLLSILLLAVALACGQPPAAPAPRLVDLAGSAVDPFAVAGRASVFVFLRTDCPISNRYAPVVRDLAAAYAGRNVNFWLVYVDPDEPVEAIRRHVAEYSLPGTPLRDAHHDLVHRTGATVTPEAAVYTAQGTLAYRGRIDDRYVGFGKMRPEPTRHDLRDALNALLAGRPVQSGVAPAIGCFIRDLAPGDDS